MTRRSAERVYIKTNMKPLKFAIVGLGFISDRHISAINSLGHELVCACDIDPEKAYKANGVKFFDNFNDMVDSKEFRKVDYVSICTPNHLHFPMISECLLHSKKVLCEKPPVINKGEFKLLKHNKDVKFVFQCRLADAINELEFKGSEFHKVQMNIEVYRDEWYMKSWKANDRQSGGLLYNIGVHYFDLLTLFFGDAKGGVLTVNKPRRCEGSVKFENAEVNFTVAIDAPIDKQKRIFKINDNQLNLTQLGFESLHKRVYEHAIKEGGFVMGDFEPAHELIEKLYGTNRNS